MTSLLEKRPLRFIAPRERTKLIGPLGGREIVASIPFLVIFFVELFVMNSITLFVLTVLFYLVIFFGSFPGGETVFEWLPRAITYARGSVTGRNTWNNPSATNGYIQSPDGPRPIKYRLPPMIGALHFEAFRVGKNRDLGICMDGPGLYTGSLRMEVKDFILQPYDRQEDLLKIWGQILANRARELSTIHRISWLVRTIPGDPEAHRKYVERTARPGFFDDPATVEYREQIANSDRHSVDYEITVSLTIAVKKAGRQLRERGGGHRAACRLLAEELQTLGRELADIDHESITPVTYSRLISDSKMVYEPFQREKVLGLERARNGEARSESEVWPSFLKSHKDYAETDGAWHRVYYVKGFSQRGLPPEFAHRFLADSNAPKEFLVVIQPVPPKMAQSHTGREATTNEADMDAREKSSRRIGAQRRRALAIIEKRDEAFAAGESGVRMMMFTRTAGPTKEEAAHNSAVLEELCTKSSMEIAPLTYGHAEGLTLFLPAGRGLQQMTSASI